MRANRVLIVCTVVNVVVMLFTLLHVNSISTNDVPAVLRGRALQIVDDQGRVRASINVYPASRQKNGEIYPETVLLRLITERGTAVGQAGNVRAKRTAGPRRSDRHATDVRTARS